MSNEKIVWIDTETTGIDAQKDSLIQVACIITDANLDEIDGEYESKIYYSPENVEKLKAKTSDYVIEMHSKSGLWDELPFGTEMLQVDEDLHNFIVDRVPESHSARLGGNSITLDRNFLELNLPKTFNHLHYQSYDMSSIANFFSLFAPEVGSFEKKFAHTALDDIRESIGQARFYADFLKKCKLS